jgi:hypothetical protein
MSAHDEIFPDKPPAPRRPRPAAPPSDFDDPAVRATYRPGGKYGHIFHRAPEERDPERAACTHPVACQVGDHAHRLAIATHRPAPGERRVSHLRTWEWDEAGQAWRCVAVHASGAGGAA